MRRKWEMTEGKGRVVKRQEDTVLNALVEQRRKVSKKSYLLAEVKRRFKVQ